MEVETKEISKQAYNKENRQNQVGSLKASIAVTEKKHLNTFPSSCGPSPLRNRRLGN